MADTKTDLWDRLGKTDPKHTSKFKRSGGFSGTAIKPIWSIRSMTEEFGPCGSGWGINEPSFQVVPSTDETLVFCTVSIWHGQRENVVYGVGGDKVVAKFSSGIRSDDEAFKKAFTDAVTNAMKMIGVGADVHMGLFDDSKYVASLRENPHVTKPSDIMPEVEYDDNGQPLDNIPVVEGRALPKKDSNQAYKNLQNELWTHTDIGQLQEWAVKIAPRVAALPADWAEIFRGQYKEHLAHLRTVNGKAA